LNYLLHGIQSGLKMKQVRFLSNYSIPDSFQNTHCFCEPLKPDHIHLDYEAVMSSRQFLRLWSKSDWPSDNFQLEDNLNDLVMHEKEHIEGVAYTYTILSVDKNECLGCLYVNPTDRIEPVTDHERNLLNQRPATIRFWIRNSYQNTDKESIIVKDLISWFKLTWGLKEILFSCNKQVPGQIKLFRSSGLFLWLELQNPSRHELLWSIY